MPGNNEPSIQRQLRSPRAAAIAGIIFSVLHTFSLGLLSTMAIPDEFTTGWLETWSNTSKLVLGIVPFSGIAFLWFTGVIRDRLEDREDRFFDTIFFGSGIILVVLMLIWAAILGAIFRSYALTAQDLIDNDVFIFGFTFMNEIIGNYSLRMAGVYMLSIGTLWTRTGVMPRWLTIITYIVALGFLFFAGTIIEFRFIFPGWVFLISVYVLVLNYRRTHKQENHDELHPGNDAPRR